MSISKEAIGAGVRAYWLEGQAAGVILTHTTYDDMDRFIREGLVRAFTKGVEVALQERSASQDCKVPAQNVTSPPATATQVAIDDEEVRRVMAVLHEAGCGNHKDFKPFWESYHSEEGSPQREKYERAARAAIRAIREGGQRWGVEATGPDKKKCWVLGQDPEKEFSTHDKEAADLVCGLLTKLAGRSNMFTYEVRPYPGEREKTETPEPSKEVQDIMGILDQLNGALERAHAAIRDAKGGK